MSTKNRFSLFPELSTLKNTLWEIQGEFAGTKPQLDAALSKLAPTGFTTPLDELEEAAKLQLTGEIPAALRETLDLARDVYRQAEEMLADRATREKIIRGEYDQEILDLAVSVVAPNYDRLYELYREIPSLSYGTESIEKEHLMETRIGVMNIVLNRVFELIDIRPPLQVRGEKIVDFFDGMSQRLADLVETPLMQPTWDLLGAWMQRWEGRPELREAVTRHIPIVTIRLLNPRNIDNYRKGDRIADLKLYFGKLQAVRVVGGMLPLGLELNEKTGSVQVAEPKLLFPGIFSGIRLGVENDQGYSGELELGEIEFSQDFEAVYTVFSPKKIAELKEGELLAYPTDRDGSMAGAQIAGGSYPPGTRFNTSTGELVLRDPSRVVPGSYTMRILTLDGNGGRTEHEVTMVFEGGSGAVTGRYVTEGTFVLPLQNGFLIAKPDLSSGYVVGAAILQGFLPSGIGLMQNGEVLVTDSAKLGGGTFSLEISLSISGAPALSLPLSFSIQSESSKSST